MALLNAGQLTLLDIAKRTDPDGQPAKIAELLNQQNLILEDILWKEANAPTSHTVTIRTGLPTSYWRAYNLGTPASKSTSAQVVEPMAMLESRSVADQRMVDQQKNPAAFRFTEESSFIESMNQEMTAKIFNGNVGTDAKTFSGFATRCSSTTAGNGNNVILAGGAGSDNASMYLVAWGENACYMTYPEKSTSGLQYEDLGVIDAFDSNNNRYRAYSSLFRWDAGLVVYDWRYVVRIANIDVSDWIGVTGSQATSSATNLIKLMVRAISRLPEGYKGTTRAAFYCNRSIGEGLMIQALEKSNNVLSIQDALTQFGTTVKTLYFMGVPVRICDGLGIAETLVS